MEGKIFPAKKYFENYYGVSTPSETAMKRSNVVLETLMMHKTGDINQWRKFKKHEI